MCRLVHLELPEAAHILPDTHPRGEAVVPHRPGALQAPPRRLRRQHPRHPARLHGGPSARRVGGDRRADAEIWAARVARSATCSACFEPQNEWNHPGCEAALRARARGYMRLCAHPQKSAWADQGERLRVVPSAAHLRPNREFLEERYALFIPGAM